MFKVEALTSERNVITQEFEDTDVDMPILSVTSLSANGKKGSHVHFRDNGGDVIEVHTQKKSAFIKQRGVYFIRLYVKKGQPASATTETKDMGFTRPGMP